MDKNKALYKIKGLPPIYCINLDGKPDRWKYMDCLLYTSPSPRDRQKCRMPSSA